MDSFYRNTYALLESIDSLLEKRHLMPCLALIYAGIDVMASIERQPGEHVKESFVRWVEQYMFPARQLRCTALELYAARCGILHTFTVESDLSRRGHARTILYAWGTANTALLDAATAKLQRTGHVSLHIDDLIHAFRHGLADYLQAVSENPERQAQVESRAGAWLSNMDTAIVRRFVDGDADAQP